MFWPVSGLHQIDPKNMEKEIIQLQYLSEICDLRMCYTNCIVCSICIAGFTMYNCRTVYTMNTGSCIFIRLGVKHFVCRVARAPVGQGIITVEGSLS